MHIYIALPLMAEHQTIKKLIQCMEEQTFQHFHVVVCVNQPNSWWDDPQKQAICLNNKSTIQYLNKFSKDKFTIIDKSSRGCGWDNKRNGVGWARKTCMDHINQQAQNKDIIISMDGDTIFHPQYFESVVECFKNHPKATGLANPYYHPLTSDDAANRAILRYEIYMRNYNINLLRIHSPYAYTALGSAMAVPLWAYRAIGGITPQKSGEDFYFLQKLRKFGPLIIYNHEKVYPAARFSDRVFFGTGPAMIKGHDGDWNSYPIYDYKLFDNIAITYQCFTKLHQEDIETPLTPFLNKLFKNNTFWVPLRKNNPKLERFIKACHDKTDGLRILQYLKHTQQTQKTDDNTALYQNIKALFSEQKLPSCITEALNLDTATTTQLNEIRDFLVIQEENLQQATQI